MLKYNYKTTTLVYVKEDLNLPLKEETVTQKGDTLSHRMVNIETIHENNYLILKIKNLRACFCL